jgi:hypothetical protein
MTIHLSTLVSPRTWTDAALAANNSRLLRLTLFGAALVLMALAGIWVWRQAASNADWPAGADIGLYLDAAASVVNGESPYAGSEMNLHRYPYPPLFADFMALLTIIFGRELAGFVWMAAGAGFLIASVLIMTRRFGFTLPYHWALLAAGILMMGRTGRSDLMHGQLNFSLTFLLVTGLLSWREGRSWLASALWALAICCKPFLGVIVLFLLRRGDWRTAATTFALSGVVFLLSFLPTFPNALDTFWGWREVTQHYAAPAYAANPLNQSFYGFGLRLFTENDFSQPWVIAPMLALLMLVAAGFVAVGAFWINAGAPDTQDRTQDGAYDLLGFAASLAALMSLGPVTEGDHLYFGLPGLAGSLAIAWRKLRANAPDARLWLIVALPWLAIAALLAWPKQALFHFNATESWRYLEGVTLLISGACGLALLTAAGATAWALRHGRKAITPPLELAPARPD